MNSLQAEQMLGYLALIHTALTGLRSDFDEFRAYGTQNIDAITGTLGYSITDLAGKLDEIEGKLAMIDINTSV